MVALLALATGPLGKILGVLLAVLSLGGGLIWIVQEHDAKVLAESAVQEQAKTIAVMKADAERSAAALVANAKATADIASKATTIREAVDAAPRTTGCSDSPAIRAALDGLRNTAAGANHGAAATGSAKPMGTAASAATAGSGKR